jgi:hypothetical protein
MTADDARRLHICDDANAILWALHTIAGKGMPPSPRILATLRDCNSVNCWGLSLAILYAGVLRQRISPP